MSILLQYFRNSNVIILTTSNITGAIDLAFVDRADIKQYIGLPSTDAIYKIYQSSIAELVKVRKWKYVTDGRRMATLLLLMYETYQHNSILFFPIKYL